MDIPRADPPASSTQPSPANQPRSIRSTLERILLRRKDPSTPSLLSASRAPASEVLTAANYIESHTKRALAPTRLSDIPHTIANALPDVPSLHTYKGDITTTMREQNVSLSDIAQAQMQQARSVEQAAASKRPWVRRHTTLITQIAVGVLLLAGAAGVLAWLYVRLSPLSAPARVSSAIIYADQQTELLFPAGSGRTETMSALVAEARRKPVPLGLILAFNLTVASTTRPVSAPLITRDFLARVAPRAPDMLVRALRPQFLLGLYGFGGNKPFLIFRTDEYEQAYAGMLQWEYTLADDLAPFFPKYEVPAAADSASSTASSTAASESPARSSTGFSDAILNNHDARAIRNAQGDVSLLWSFIDRSTLIIATDPETLTAAASRLQKAATTDVPGR